MSSVNNRSAQWYRFIQELLQEHILTMVPCDLGGPGHIVMIDEAKFGKRHYNRGHRVEGNWVFGGCEYVYDPSTYRFYTGQVFAIVCNDRSWNSLNQHIAKWIRPGTLVWSDDFGSYRAGTWEELGLSNERVNHSKEFKSETGVHTNAIEGLWAKFKAKIPNRVYHDAERLQLFLYGLVFLRNHHVDRFAAIIKALSLVRFDSKKKQFFIDKDKWESRQK